MTEPNEYAKRYPWALRVERFSDDGMHEDLRAELREHLGHDASPEDIQALREQGARIGWRPPRNEWGDGPWQTEPDLVEWRSGDLSYPLLAVRGNGGAWCGYVGLPPGHPLHGLKLTDPAVAAAACETITWARASCRPVRATGEPPVHWFLGFDCGHAMQYSPRMEALIVSELDPVTYWVSEVPYVTFEEVRAMTEELAESFLFAAKTRAL